ncbi:hypothetical protein LJC64_01160 [Ruminococcaceae bacterium OttesenSCG-928-A11]|nr:hypothetical protein [Ruminococcaceae bacterium OttesenSCG-928-A11]
MEQFAVQGQYLLKLKEDDMPPNPRDEADNFGTMVCFHPRYRLGDAHSYRDSDDFLLDVLSDTLGSDEEAERFREHIRDNFDHEAMGWPTYDRAVDDCLLKEISKNNVILPLYLYDHSGITINTTGFSCPWDSGQVGWIYATEDAVLKDFGGKLLNKDNRAQAEKLLAAEVKQYDHYLRNDCYRYELYENGEEIDSCSGFLGDIDEVRNALKSYLQEECQGMVEMLEESPPPRRHTIKELMDLARARQASQISPASGRLCSEAR